MTIAFGGTTENVPCKIVQKSMCAGSVARGIKRWDAQKISRIESELMGLLSHAVYQRNRQTVLL